MSRWTNGHTNHVSTRVPNWSRADPNLDQTSVLASTRRFEINLLALKYALEPSPWRIVRGIGSEKAKRLTNRFGRCVAVELLSGRVPCLNSCARIDAENASIDEATTAARRAFVCSVGLLSVMARPP